jgi:hypothetical protein
MERNKRPDDLPGYIRVTVQALETSFPDTKIDINDHFTLATGERSVPATRVVELLEEHWETSMRRSQEIIDSIMGIEDGV